ncbi:putative fungal specific transcription protein [Botrytis cinerea BcDW1]|uniref:Putative fungal specific transcription protein n=1 Tax=Botryotinia fuckeliana (strain BcDW1) TaxID=1290391 RepID=M7USM5_BOTF1|nr:putative fungal specific transcription protein [Botrytis cinerea BcDW1]
MQAFYLDSEVWSSFDFTRQPSSVILSAEVLAYLDDVDETKRKYFSSTHTWMPIISKMRLNRLTDSAVGKTRVDIALLLLCMKLVPDGVAEDENKPSDLYLTAKQLCATLERNCLLTLRSLQANLLLAVYEVGHAIYPAAALTVGCCVRQGVALGLHNKDAPQLGVIQYCDCTLLKCSFQAYGPSLMLRLQPESGNGSQCTSSGIDAACFTHNRTKV